MFFCNSTELRRLHDLFTTQRFFRSISQLAELLDSAHLDIRMAAGECIALLLEQGRELSDDWLDEVGNKNI